MARATRTRSLIVENVRNAPVTVGTARRLRLAPLERRQLTDSEFEVVRGEIEQSDDVRVDPAGTARPPSLPGDMLNMLLGAAAAALLVVAAFAVGDNHAAMLVGAIAGLAVVALSARLVAARRGAIAAERLRHTMSFYWIAAIAVLAPALVIGWSTDMTLWYDWRAAGDDRIHYMMARLVQMGFVGVASLVPAFLFYAFERRRASAVRRRMVRALFRLDPALESLPEVEAKYGEQLAEIGGGNVQHQHRSVVGLATAILAGGWVVTLTNGDVTFESGRSFSSYLFALLTPHQSLVTYAFLGAYVFTIHLVLRSYVRGDLMPKTYGLAMVRVLTVFVFASALDLMLAIEGGGTWNDAAYLTAFLIGVVPSEFFRVLEAYAKKLATSAPGWGTRLAEREPLTSLHGVDIYDQTRLELEGVNNVEALAHADLIELMFSTRIPPERLVDWVDQALLAVRIPLVRTDGDTAPPASEDLRSNLRHFGVRTATDLFQAMPRVAAHLPADQPTRVALIAETLEDEEWLCQLRAWRCQGGAVPAELRSPLGLAVR